MKKIISVVLVTALAFTLLAVSASAANTSPFGIVGGLVTGLLGGLSMNQMFDNLKALTVITTIFNAISVFFENLFR